MSARLVDQQGRWRNKIVSIRMSPEENDLLNRLVSMSGLTKQEYITRRLLVDDVIVEGNPRVYKALRDNLAEVLVELRRIEAGSDINHDLLRTINQITTIMEGMKKGETE